MRTNLSSQISLNRVSPKYYKPENAVERSVLTRCEKVPTDIYETMEEGVQQIANEITAKIQERQREGKFCVIGAGTGASLRPLYAELVRKHKDEGLSFRNVVIFNLYEYYPLASCGIVPSMVNTFCLSISIWLRNKSFSCEKLLPAPSEAKG